MKEKLKNFKWGYAIIAFILLLIGVFLIVFTETLKVVAITIGVILSVAAIVMSILTLAKKERGVKFGFKIAFEVMVLIAGLVSAIFYGFTINVMISVFSLLLIIDASFKLHTTAMCKRYSLPLWWVLLSIAVLTIIGGYFFIRSDFTFTEGGEITAQMKLLSILLGICFILDAASNILTPFFVSAYEKALKVDVLSELQREKMHELDDVKTVKEEEKKEEKTADGEKAPEEKKPEEKPEEKEEKNIPEKKEPTAEENKENPPEENK